MAFLDRGDSAGQCAAQVVVCSTALTSVRPRADDAIFDDIVIECTPLEKNVSEFDSAVTIKLTRDEALQLCAEIALQLKTLPILKPKPKSGPSSVNGN